MIPRRRPTSLLTAALALGVAAAAAPSAPAATIPVPAGVQRVLTDVTTKPSYDHSIWGYQLRDAGTGEVLLEHNEQKMFVTGSILKLYATATALDVLGSDFRFSTPVHKRGRVANGRLDGDLVLVASGDYSFGLREQRDGTLSFNSAPQIDHNYADTGLPGAALPPNSRPLAGVEDLAKQVRASGIRSVEGDVAIDDRLFETFDGWPDGRISPMWINENVIDITSKPTRAGEPAKVDWRPRTAALRVVSKVKTVSGEGTPLVVDAPRPGVIRIRGTIGVRSAPVVSISQIADPASFGRTAFIEALRRNGVSVAAEATGANPTRLLPRNRTYARNTRVAERVSPPLPEYVKTILKVSYNRGTDDLVCMIAVAKGSRDCIDGLDAEMDTIERFGVSPITTILFDGAGSSEYDRSTPQDYTTFLRNVAGAPWGPTLRGALPILGVDGTFATNQRGTPAAGHVFLKSGTRAQIAPTGRRGILSALTQAGYIDAASGRRLTFAIMLRDLSLSPDLRQFGLADEDMGQLAAAFQQGY